jgi:hypothetical protein
MSDYVSELRRDLVDAAERHAHRGRVGLLSRPLHPRAWSPTALAGAAAVAAAVVAVVVTLTTLAPPPKPSDAKIVATVRLGGQPQDAVLAGGSLWIADSEGRVLRLDAATRRVRARIPVGGAPVTIAAGGAVVWVMSVDPGSASRSHLIKLDVRSGRIVERVAVNGFGGAMAAGPGGLWLVPDHSRADIERIDPGGSHQRTAFLPNLGARELTVSGQSIWTRGDDNSAIEIDGASGRIVNRVRGISSEGVLASARNLLADRDGLWAVLPAQGMLYRVEGGRITQRIAVGDHADGVARVGRAIWVGVQRGRVDGWEVVRVDPDDGKVVERVELGSQVPQTLVPVGKDLWVITGHGDAKLVSPG